jgi:hypothetical protein
VLYGERRKRRTETESGRGKVETAEALVGEAREEGRTHLRDVHILITPLNSFQTLGVALESGDSTA